MTDDRPRLESAADAWAKWAEDFLENPNNPPRGSWMALKECFYGGVFAAVNIVAPRVTPRDGASSAEMYEDVRQRVRTLYEELAKWAERDVVDTEDFIARGTQKGIDDQDTWLLDQTTNDPALLMYVWNLMEQDEDGKRNLPDLGFGPQLLLAVAALRGIYTGVFPREDDPGGEPKFDLATDMRTLAYLALHELHALSVVRNDEDDGA